MKTPKLILCLLSMFALAFGAYAVDQGSGADTGNSSGIPKVNPCRWITVRNSTYNGTPAAQSNLLQAVSSVLGKVVVVPGGVGDTVTIYNAGTYATATAANEIFTYTIPATATNSANASPVYFGIPMIFDLGSGVAAANGLLVNQTMGVTNDGMRVYISYDKAISGRN